MTKSGRAEGEMTCQELVELVTEYLEGGLSTSERSRFDSHLATCSGCEEHLAQMRATLELSGRIEESGVAPAALDSLLDAFRGWKQRS